MEYIEEATLSGWTPFLNAARSIIAEQKLSLTGFMDKRLRTIISNGESYISYY